MKSQLKYKNFFKKYNISENSLPNYVVYEDLSQVDYPHGVAPDCGHDFKHKRKIYDCVIPEIYDYCEQTIDESYQLPTQEQYDFKHKTNLIKILNHLLHSRDVRQMFQNYKHHAYTITNRFDIFTEEFSGEKTVNDFLEREMINYMKQHLDETDKFIRKFHAWEETDTNQSVITLPSPEDCKGAIISTARFYLMVLKALYPHEGNFVTIPTSLAKALQESNWKILPSSEISKPVTKTIIENVEALKKTLPFDQAYYTAENI